MAAEKENIVGLLKKLATDDSVRGAITENSLGVLREHGIEVSEKDLPPQVNLPSKEEIEKNFDKIVDALVSPSAQMWFFLQK